MQMTDRMHGVPIHRVWDAELRTFIDVTDEPKGGPVTDAPRRTRLELDWMPRGYDSAWVKVGPFVLHAGILTGGQGMWTCRWATKRPPHDDYLASDSGFKSLQDAQLAAESWLAEAVREPAERLIAPPPPGQ